MAEQLSMNRIIHAAVRRDVNRTERALRALRDGDGARAREIQVAWRNLVRELTHHHEAEDSIAWPFLAARGFDTSLLAEMEAEHVADEAGAGLVVGGDRRRSSRVPPRRTQVPRPTRSRPRVR